MARKIRPLTVFLLTTLILLLSAIGIAVYIYLVMLGGLAPVSNGRAGPGVRAPLPDVEAVPGRYQTAWVRARGSPKRID